MPSPCRCLYTSVEVTHIFCVQSATPEPMTHAQLQQECTKHLNMKYLQHQQQQQQQMRMHQQTNGALTTGADAQVSAAALLKSNAASSLLGPQAASPISETFMIRTQ